MGPIECIEFADDEHGLKDNFACVVFKYPSSVEDSIRLLQDTKLYGLEIVLEKYSEQLKNPAFDEQLNYFKQLVNVERSNQSNHGNTSRWNDQNLDNQNIIPDSLPGPPTHGKYNLNYNNFDHKSSDIMPRNNYQDGSFKYQHSNSFTNNRDPNCRSQHRPVEKFHPSHYQKLDHNNHSDPMVSNTHRNSRGSSYHNQNYDRKHQQDYSSYPSSKWNESNYYNQEHSNKNFSAENVLPVRDLRDTIHRKRNVLDSDNIDTNSNATCTSILDLRDTMYHSKNNRYKDVEPSYQPESKKQWSEKKSYSHDGGKFSNKPYRNDNNTSEHYNESKTKAMNHYSNQEYNNQSFNHDTSYDSFQEHEYPNNFDSYNHDRNRPNNSSNHTFNQSRHKSKEFRDCQNNSYHSYKHHSDESQERKEYKNTYNELSGCSRGRNSYRGGFDKSRRDY